MHEEYYVNDAGRQMDILAASVWLRYAEETSARRSSVSGERVSGRLRSNDCGHVCSSRMVTRSRPMMKSIETIVERPQESSRKRASIESSQRSRNLIGLDGFEDNSQRFAERAYSRISKTTSAALVSCRRTGTRSADLVDGPIQRALQVLDDRDMLYTRDGAKWFKATRSSVMRRTASSSVKTAPRRTSPPTSRIIWRSANAASTYLLDVLGADHHGYVARVRAGLEAMGQPSDCLEVRLVQFVALYRGQEKAQMSTRSGEFVTLRQLRDEVGNDAARFFYVSRSNDQHLDFDMGNSPSLDPTRIRSTISSTRTRASQASCSDCRLKAQRSTILRQQT